MFARLSTLRSGVSWPLSRALPVDAEGVRVLCYHSISDMPDAGILTPYVVPVAQFEHHLDALLADGCVFISPDQFVDYVCHAAGVPPRSILLTFDDGYEDLEENVLPILKARSIPALAFVVTARLGQSNLWDVAAGAPEIRLLGVDGLRRIVAGGIEIGAHTRTHPSLRSLDGAALRDELAGSILDLEGLGFRPLGVFAYPYGALDSRVVSAVKSAGIRLAFTIKSGIARAGRDPFRIPRTIVVRSDDTPQLRARILAASQRTTNA